MPTLTELQKTQIAYAHFTLEEWEMLVKCVSHTNAHLFATKQALDIDVVKGLLSKFPSVVL